ncbi:cyclic nucleotide-binding domain-containing protein [Pseudomonadales bacterium]|jgi:CRP-like cAMP-binding protein|nr:cyclic nucleotide-binding domain-containing protein [Pseudomonadales bacterium]MDA8790119.1 cyclic nucleotide-binding domain-containing protein [Pseudomonadales bacterium]MDB4363353.1 cyclic nucleotide-binding domain-containing protein [Pseudomonadales bacterium]MDB4824973.1 cyclic nucleotide-binding domain-containing protein [Pseudomonadales bacterium]
MNENINSAQYRLSGVEPLAGLLNDFVPMQDLSSAHLHSVARSSKLTNLPVGQLIADRNFLDNFYCYLVSGEVAVTHGSSMKPVTYSAEDFGRLSLGDFLKNIRHLRAASDVQVLVVARKELDSMLCWDQVAKSLSLELTAERSRDEDRDWINTLLTSNLFHKIPPYNIRRVLDKFTPRLVQAGEVVVRQGERGDECYIIKEGRAVVSVEESTLPAPQVLAELVAGQCFGEEALANMTLRNASVTMDRNGVLMVLKKRDFLALMSEPKIAGVSSQQAAAMVAAGATWLDVRSQQEFDHEHYQEAFHLPLHLLAIKARLMSDDGKYMAYCSTGRRACAAAMLLRQQGFDVTPVVGHVALH